MSEPDCPKRIMLTGATGFVGRYVFRELVSRGFTPVCLVRSPQKMRCVAGGVAPACYATVQGTLFEPAALAEAADGCQAVIHLVGVILENRRQGQTFGRIHCEGTRRVLEAAQNAGTRRYIHMSAIGTRPDAVSRYHRTKYEAEQSVRNSGLAYTIFQPSVIHGPDGEFMQLMKSFVCGLFPPVMPYFGTGNNLLQPVSVKDVAYCFVEALTKDDAIGQTYPLGGPDRCNWKEFYETCRELIPGARRWKPKVGQPVFVAKLLARTIMKTPLVPQAMRFNVSQVQMSQEDSVCDTRVVEDAFGIRLRSFRQELALYGDRV